MVARIGAGFGPPGLRAVYGMKRKNGNHRKATIALARRLIVIIWRMLRDEIPFDWGYNRAQEIKKRRREKGNLRRLKELKEMYDAERVFNALQNHLKSKMSQESKDLVAAQLPS